MTGRAAHWPSLEEGGGGGGANGMQRPSGAMRRPSAVRQLRRVDNIKRPSVVLETSLADRVGTCRLRAVLLVGGRRGAAVLLLLPAGRPLQDEGGGVALHELVAAGALSPLLLQFFGFSARASAKEKTSMLRGIIHPNDFW